MSIEDEIASLVARLLAHRWLPREDELARRALLDDHFREELDRRLAAVGLVLREHPYSAYIGVGLARSSERAVFSTDHGWLSNTLQLDRDAIALLVVVWALIILPKRQRQLERQKAEDAAQSQMFADRKPIPVDPDIAPLLAERTLLADFGDKLGGKMRINVNLGQLARHGFIQRLRGGEIAEGPLLDLVFDYERTARRILDGALSDLLFPEDREDAAADAQAQDTDGVAPSGGASQGDDGEATPGTTTDDGLSDAIVDVDGDHDTSSIAHTEDANHV